MSGVEFRAWPKIARLNRDIIVTEKIDGTNACVIVTEDGVCYAQSRNRLITPEQDNAGFAAWVYDHTDELAETLGEGYHYGEWWGKGIQRNYGLSEKRFSLFNTVRWGQLEYQVESAVPGLSVVPVLYEGMFNQNAIDNLVLTMRSRGSQAAPGFMNPEGVVVFHTAARQMFKVTLEGDERPKGLTE